jgi:hypothetical protein
VAIGVLEVQAAAAVTVVDRLALGLARICSVGQVLVADAAERCIELLLAHQERIMLGRDIPACLGEIQRDASVWFAVRAAPTPAPPTTAQANACHGRSTNAKPA